MTRFELVALSCLLANIVGTGADGSPDRSEKLAARCGTQGIFEMEYDLNKPLHPRRFIHPPRALQGGPGRAEFA